MLELHFPNQMLETHPNFFVCYIKLYSVILQYEQKFHFIFTCIASVQRNVDIVFNENKGGNNKENVVT